MLVAAFVISIAALVVAIMALPTVAQMIWGKPTLTIKFDHKDLEKGRVMVCKLYNYPIVKGFKKNIGVRRMPIEDMIVSFSINEYATNKVVWTGSVPNILKHDGITGAQRISLAASVFPAHFGIIISDYATKTVDVFDAESNKLLTGKYVIKVKATFQEQVTQSEGVLIVTNEYPYAHWQ